MGRKIGTITEAGGKLQIKRREFNVYGSVHRNNILIYIQQDATLHSLFYVEIPLNVSVTVSTVSGICHIVTATCRYRGRVRTLPR